MARADGGKVELLEYPLFDTWFSGVGQSGIQQNTQMFAANNIGKPQYTNMQQASQIPSGGQFFVTSLRVAPFFQSLADSEYTVAYSTISAQTAPTSSNARMLDCYSALLYGSQATLIIAQKPQLIVPTFMLPAGGGPSGISTASGRSIVTNGLPSKDAIAKFVKPIEVSSLQAFTVQMSFYDWARNSTAGGFTALGGGGGSITADFSPKDLINTADGIKECIVILGGATTRDIN